MTKAECNAAGGIFTNTGGCIPTASSIPGLRELMQQPQKVASLVVADARSRQLSWEKWTPWLIVGGLGLGTLALLRYKRLI